MSEILTQKEIDALLTGVPVERQGAAADVVPYNFVRPPRISRDRRTALDAVHQRFALSLQTLLSSRLRTTVDVTIAGVEQVLFSEFLLSLGSPCAAFVFKTGGSVEGHGVIDLSTDFAYHLVDRLFGGPGEPEKLQRGLTPLEQTVIRGMTERMVGVLREAWQEQLAIAPEIVGFESEPEALHIAAGDDHVLVANVDVRAGQFLGQLAICLPTEPLDAFLQDHSALRLQGRVAKREPGRRPPLAAPLQHARVTVCVRMPAFRMTTRDVAHLAPGQVIDTGSSSAADLELHVNGRFRFVGTIGQVRRGLGLRISHAVLAPEPQRSGPLKEGRVS